MAQIDWNATLQTFEKGLVALSPILELAVPESAVAINLIGKVAQGVVAAEPAAVALFNRAKSGAGVTQEQLVAYIQDNDAANAQLQADVAAKLATSGG